MSEIMEYPDGATPLEPEELEGLKFAHITTRSQLDHLEQANIAEGSMWLSRQKSPDVLDDLFARKLHKQLFGQVWKWAGEYRNTEKNIGVDPLQISVQLRSLIEDVKCWVEFGTYEPLEAAARFHHKLVFIHPFPNGNGRFSRIMADTFLERVYDMPPIDWAAGQDLQKMNERRTSYLSALRAADKGEFQLLFEFVGV